MKSFISRCAHLAPSIQHAWWALSLRLIVGYGLIEHGYAKIARGPAAFTSILEALGMPHAAVLAWATILIELFGGFAVLVGLFIPVASIPMTVVLAVAIATVHLPNGFSSIKLQSVTAAGAHFGQPGYETDLLYLAALVALILGGSGPLALDRFLLRRRPFATSAHMIRPASPASGPAGSSAAAPRWRPATWMRGRPQS